MKLFESILDSEEIISNADRSADLRHNAYEKPTLKNHPYMLMLANGCDSYDKLIESPNLIAERFERLQNAMQSFRHIKSCSDFSFYLYEDEQFPNMPEYVLISEFATGFFVSFEPDFRTKKETFRFLYILNQIATGGIGGSIKIISSNYTSIFVDYENMDWLAEYNNLPSAKYRSHNMFYSESKILEESEKIFKFLKPDTVKILKIYNNSCYFIVFFKNNS